MHSLLWEADRRLLVGPVAGPKVPPGPKTSLYRKCACGRCYAHAFNDSSFSLHFLLCLKAEGLLYVHFCVSEIILFTTPTDSPTSLPGGLACQQQKNNSHHPCFSTRGSLQGGRGVLGKTALMPCAAACTVKHHRLLIASAPLFGTVPACVCHNTAACWTWTTLQLAATLLC